MKITKPLGIVVSAILLASCGSGSDSASPVIIAPPPVTPPAPPPSGNDNLFSTAQATSRFLTYSTFGPKPEEVDALVGTNASAWVQAEFNKDPSPVLDSVIQYYNLGDGRARMMLADPFDSGANMLTFWKNAVESEDQLRQRMIYALSQILVVSNVSGLNGIFPQTVGYYHQLLSNHAFGNYEDLLIDVTYSPSMAEYLTYLGNVKADPLTGSVPDENYAREILQLFTIGLIELNPDGSPKLDSNGDQIELYTNDDITELAKVFTGLRNPDLVYSSGQDLARGRARITAAVQEPLTMDDSLHSSEAKSFLGTTIAENTSGDESIRIAIEHIMEHPNVGPFVSQLLIQRFTTSNPSPAYIRRVASAFDTGEFTLPDGSRVGEGRKGDLKATLSAILFDQEVTDIDRALSDDTFGKVREPILRVTHFARAFDADMSSPEYLPVIYDTASLSSLGQQPWRSPSVFNFYRPGYVAPGTASGELGLKAPELQIVNASSIPGYINLLSYGTFSQQEDNFESLRPLFQAVEAEFNGSKARSTFIPNYDEAIELADDSAALVDYLDNLLLYGSMSDSSRQSLIDALDNFPRSSIQDPDSRQYLVGYAVLMVMSSPDYIIQR